jgi:integrase
MLYTTKNGDVRYVPLLPQALAELQRIKGDSKAADLIFGSMRVDGVPFNHTDPWKAALKAARIKGATFHTTRHSAASHMAMAQIPMVDIAKILGHRSLAMTLRYSHFSTQHSATNGTSLRKMPFQSM